MKQRVFRREAGGGRRPQQGGAEGSQPSRAVPRRHAGPDQVREWGRAGGDAGGDRRLDDPDRLLQLRGRRRLLVPV